MNLLPFLRNGETRSQSPARATQSRRPGYLWLAILLLVSEYNPPATFAQLPPPPEDNFRGDRLLVKPRLGATAGVLGALHSATGSQVMQRFPDLGNLQILRLAPGADLDQVLAAYQQSGAVEYAERDYIVQCFLDPNDFRYWDGSLWGLRNTGIYGGVPGADIHASEGWNIQNTASDVVVAVIDTGARYTHEDLAPNMWINPGESGRDLLGLDKSSNGIDDDGNGYVDDVHGINVILGTGMPMDDHGHGTHVSGTIGAVGNNSVGVVGVAWRVQIMACKMFDAMGNGSISDAVTCIDYARQKGARIINASWGSSTFTSAALRDAINSTRTAGMLFVAAAGNNNSNNDVNPLFPASYDLDNIIAVAATTRTDDRAFFSNYGATTVDLGAPGYNIFSCWNGSDTDYRYLDGTSMATPHVVGTCALLWSRYPGETYSQIRNRVLASTDPLPELAGKCVTGGRLNLPKALGALGLQADFTAQPTSGAVPLTVQFTDRSTGSIATRVWNFGDGSPTSTETNPAHIYNYGGQFTVTLTVTAPNGASSTKSDVISAVANYQIQAATFNWIDPGAMPALALADDGVSAPLDLPFVFNFYGKSYGQIFVGANGLAGFANQGLSAPVNTDLPNTSLPNAVVCPYWADLNPAQAGSVRFGIQGTAPNREAVISWVDVPPKSSFPTMTRFTFQVVLRERSNQILFQYLQIQPNRAMGERQNGTVGLENETGIVAAKYTFNENPTTLANNQALLFAPTAVAKMSVTPASGLSASGNQGGPFSPSSQTYVIANSGTAPLNWAASLDQSWATLSDSGGTLAVGQQTSVIVTINSQANALGAGQYAGTVIFLNQDNGDGDTTRPLNLTVNPSGAGVLSVSPLSGFSSQGPRGGPFSPASQVYTLTNSGDSPLTWSASDNKNWVSLSATGGTLAPSASANVTVSINSNANKLKPNTYSALVSFVNASTGQGNTSRTVTLTVLRN